MPRAALVALAGICALVFVLALPQLSRPGYTPDEEFTAFAVRGIAATGLPLLPSGLLYDRGLAFSYTSWAAGAIGNSELPAYRLLALLSSIAALAFIYLAVARIASRAAATMAVVLVATSIPFWAAATTGRFYAPFIAAYLATLFVLSRTRGTSGTNPLAPGTLGTLGILTALAFFCRLTHELAFTMAAIPLLCFVLAPRGERAKWVMPGVAIVAGLAAAQAGILALHYLAPSSGDTMIRRFFVWQVVNLFERPPDRQFGIAVVVLVIAWLVAPRRAGLSLAASLCAVAFILSLSLAYEARVSPFSSVLVASVLRQGSHYPLDMFWHIARTYPVTLVFGIALLIARLSGAGGEWRPAERAVHMAWIGWVSWFGVIESGITINYLLLPITLLLVAIAIDLWAILSHTVDRVSPAGRAVWWATCVLAIAAVASDQWRGEGSPLARLEAVRPTIDVSGIDEIRDSLEAGDRVVCTDELGCLMLVGRIDAWLALDDYVRERFVVRKADGMPVGVYTGRPAVFRPRDLFEGKAAERTVVVDVFKEFPVGNTRNWLPRALERDGLEVVPLLETPQARVLLISPPVQNARK